jgi:enoyl-CoA hydratase/carnithine racemase
MVQVRRESPDSSLTLNRPQAFNALTLEGKRFT